MTDKPEYRAQNLSYMRYEMKMLSQEDLIGFLKEMNIKELQYCQGAGVPGHANTITLQLIRERKKRMSAYLDGEGSEPIEEVEAERPQDPDAIVSTDDPGQWTEPGEGNKEEVKDAIEPIHTPKERRESDSEAI